MPFLGIEQKKGTPETLDGRLTVYALVETDPADAATAKHPVASMVNNGLLVAQGNYREQNSLRDFLKAEMGLSLEEGLGQLVDRLDGLESALDPDKLKDKIEHMNEIEDFIPTPAKIVSFHSEGEILGQEGDVFYTGYFKNIGNAVLSVNAFPIFYQARFREQVIDSVRNEIETIISQIERNEPVPERFNGAGVDTEQKILKEFIPSMLYCRKDLDIFNNAEKQFRTFMSGYEFDEDVVAIVNIIKSPVELAKRHYQLLELYAKKIQEVLKENYTEVDKISRAISAMEKSA